MKIYLVTVEDRGPKARQSFDALMPGRSEAAVEKQANQKLFATTWHIQSIVKLRLGVEQERAVAAALRGVQ